MLLRLAAVFLGGIVGTGLRWALDVVFASQNEGFPVSTLLVNVVGSLALGVLVGGIRMRAGVPGWVGAGLGTGVLGSFTTFSALASALVVQTASEQYFIAGIYLIASLLLGLGAALLGLRIGNRIGHRARSSARSTG